MLLRWPALLLVCFLPALSAAQTVEEPTFTEDISVVEVEVPVQVLVDGKTVRGLGREDFELLVDGEPQELSWFEAIELEETPFSETAPAELPAAEAPAPVEPRWRRHYILMFDFGFSNRYGLEKAVEGARRMIETQIAPTDQIAVAIFAEVVGARILVPFGNDRRGIELGLDLVESLATDKPKRSVEKLEALDAWWHAAYVDNELPVPLRADLGTHISTLIQPLERPVVPAGVGLPIGTTKPGAAEKYRTARLSSIMGIGGSLTTLRELGRSMASLVTLLRDVPEPKHMMFFSQGIGAFAEGAETTPGLFRLKPMIDAFGDTGWVLHSIDIGGIQAPPTTALAGPEEFNSNVEVGLGVVVPAGSANNSLFYIANETGGELFENYNRIHQATEKILRRTEAIYLLAFQPGALAADAERFDIEVRLVPKMRNARVLHRPSFRAPRPATERLMSERRMDAAELVLTDRSLGELEAHTLTTVLPAIDSARVPIFVEVPTDQLDVGRKGKKKARLDVHVYAVDESGAVRAGFARELKFHLSDERSVSVAEEISLPEGRYELRLLAWDLRGGRRHLSKTPVEVPALEPDRPRLFGPLFLASDDGLRSFAPARLDDLDGLSLFELEDGLAPADPTPAIVENRGRRFLVFATGTDHGVLPELTLWAEDGTRAASEIQLERLKGNEGPARFLGLLSTEGLAAGRYRLEATLEGVTAATEVAIVASDQSR